MSPRSLPYPIFDIDNHMYETKEALLKYLPKEHRGKVGYVEVNGRPKLVVKDHLANKDAIGNEATAKPPEAMGRDVPVNRTDAIAFLGGAQNTNEECYIFQKASRLLGIPWVEHQARL